MMIDDVLQNTDIKFVFYACWPINRVKKHLYNFVTEKSKNKKLI